MNFFIQFNTGRISHFGISNTSTYKQSKALIALYGTKCEEDYGYTTPNRSPNESRHRKTNSDSIVCSVIILYKSANFVSFYRSWLVIIKNKLGIFF